LKLKELFAKANITFLGPNCLGFINAAAHVDATFARNTVRKGSIAFLSQSGALGTAALDWAEEVGVGLSHFISLGNKTGISENECLEYFSADTDVKAIVLYLEDFVDGKRFMQLVEKCSKPVVILKPGKSEAAQKALGSHTGSLAQSDSIISAALSQCGAIRVHTIEELFNLMQLFDTGKALRSPDIAVITNAGGPGVITTDAIELNQLTLTPLEGKTEKLLALNLPSASNIKNPVDVLGDALADRYQVALKTVLADANVSGVIVLLTPQVMTEIKKTALLIAELARKTDKPILVSFIGGKYVKEGRQILAKYKIPSFLYPNDAVNALSYLWVYRKGRYQKSKRPKEHSMVQNRAKVEAMLFDVHGVVDTQTAEKILSVYGIPILPSAFPQDIADARRVGAKLGYPLVMKLIHPDLLHKTDQKAVYLDIDSQEKLEQAYISLESLARKLKLSLWKVEIQQFVKGSLELILGAKKDADLYSLIGGIKVLRKHGFGHSILFGMGGIYAEIYKDVALKIGPLSLRDVDGLLDETKAGKVLSGARGKTFNVQKIKHTIIQIDLLLRDFPQINELDINPLFAKGEDVWVVDVKMIVE